ncbi:MAG TPA: type II toxin-antitoxin system prevent-host-death family antitoxin [Candidatus Methylomirabilis sp.]
MLAGGTMRIGLREANQQFSKIVKAVKAGREVILTERGKPIAVIKPLDDGDSDEAWLNRLEAMGILRRATKRGPMPRFRPIRLKGPSITKTLREERDLS